MMNDSPCIQCICMPICRHKIYGKLIGCTILFKYIYESNSSNINVTYESRLERITEAFKIPLVYVPATQLISQARTFGNEKVEDFYD